MSLERIVVKEISYPGIMDWETVERFADSIPTYSENDPTNPEWRATNSFLVDLSRDGYGLVYVKDEADKKSNPTRTIKDRAAWELATLYRDYAKGLWLKKREGLLNGNVGSLVVPRLSVVTAGNVGKAVSEMFRKYNLPPIKLLCDSSISKERIEALKQLYADIYLVDLNDIELKAGDIKRLTNNEDGVDITSVKIIEPNAVLYDWHVHEAFNENPNEIYVPYGSGRIFENYLTHQIRNARWKDPRLNIPVGRLIDISILGAEPEKMDSRADKLTKKCNPFIIFNGHDILAGNALGFTGKNTGIYKVAEEKILQGYELLSKYCETEHSGSAGLALYLQRFEEGKIDPSKKVLIVNTGKGG